MPGTGRNARNAGAVGFLVAATLAVGDSAAAAPSPINLQTTGGHQSWAVAINSSDTSVGYTDQVRSSNHVPAQWDRTGRLTPLSLPADNKGGEATGINDAGLVSGYVYGAGWIQSAVTWDKNGNRTTLPTPDSLDSIAFDVNEHGVVVGQTFQSVGGQYRAARWVDGQVTLLAPLAGRDHSAQIALTSDDVVVGNSFTNTPGDIGRAPTRWDADGTPTALPVPDGTQRAEVDGARGSIAYGWVYTDVPGGRGYRVRWDLTHGNTMSPIVPLPGDSDAFPAGSNNRGTLIGMSRGTVSSAVKWTDANTPVRLPTFPGDQFAAAYDINDSGAVVGGSAPIGTGTDYRIVVWDPAGNLTTLKSLPFLNNSTPTRINAHDSVIGYGITYTGGIPFHRSVLWLGHP